MDTASIEDEATRINEAPIEAHKNRKERLPKSPS